MDFKQNNYEVGNITNAATFKSFLHLSYEGTWLLSLWAVLLNIFMRPTLTIDFWGLHKNVNWAFPFMLWKAQKDFSRNFIVFFECIIRVSFLLLKFVTLKNMAMSFVKLTIRRFSCLIKLPIFLYHIQRSS